MNTIQIILVIFIPTVIVGVLIYGCFNILRKFEKVEDIIKQYNTFLLELSKQIEITDKELNKIEVRGSFESDDEIGFFFKYLKDLQESISKFKNEINDKTNPNN